MPEVINLPRRGRAARPREEPPAPRESRLRWLDDDLLQAIDSRARCLAEQLFRTYRKRLRDLVQWRMVEPDAIIDWRPGSDE